MSEQGKGADQGTTSPRSVLMSLPDGVAREVYTFHALFGRTEGSVLWLMFIILAYGGMMFTIGGLYGGVDQLGAIICGLLFALVGVTMLLVVPMWVRRQVKK